MGPSAQMPTQPPPAEKEEKEKPLPTLEERELNEFERLIAWEFLQLLDLEFSIEQSQALIAVPNFSWHDAADLIKAHPDWPLSVITDELT